MNRLLRLFSGLLLILALAAGSASMAVARGNAAAAAGGSTIVICSGYGVMTITLDAEGNPTGPILPCPDCLSGLAVATVADQTALPVFDARFHGLPIPADTAQIPSHPLFLPNARGPPALI